MKRIVKVFCYVLVVILLAGCVTPVNEASESGTAITDSAGRSVKVPEDVESVACLYAYTGHATVLLGAKGKISAVVNGLKRDVLMRRVLPDIDDLPQPYTSGAINIETLLSVKPDVSFVRLANLANEGEKKKLDQSGLTYIAIDFTTMEEQKRTIDFMGTALGAEDRAKAYLTYYEETLKLVADRVAKIPEAERLRVYHSVNEVARTDVAGSITDEIIAIAGLMNVIHDEGPALKLDGEKAFTSVEQIYTWDPDIVMANEPDAVKYFQEKEAFQGLRAVREGKIFQLPVGISRWGHPGSIETPIACLYIAKTAYPNAFEDIDMSAEVKKFYADFFAIDLDDDEITAILAGDGMRDARE